MHDKHVQLPLKEEIESRARKYKKKRVREPQRPRVIIIIITQSLQQRRNLYCGQAFYQTTNARFLKRFFERHGCNGQSEKKQSLESINAMVVFYFFIFNYNVLGFCGTSL